MISYKIFERKCLEKYLELRTIEESHWYAIYRYREKLVCRIGWTVPSVCVCVCLCDRERPREKNE